MRLLHLLSIMLSLAFTVLAGTAAPGRHRTSSVKSAKAMVEGGKVIRDFLISDVTTYSVNNFANSSAPYSSFNVTLKFHFSDPNSNSSTNCNYTWVQTSTNKSNSVPYSDYVACSPNGNEEYFQWEFVSYSGLNNFQLMFSHLFADPVDYPPPFDVVEYFSAPTNFTLHCLDAAGFGGCVLPDYLSPVHAVVDGISN